MNNLFKKGLGLLLCAAMCAPSFTAMAADTAEEESREVTITYNSLGDLTNAGVTLQDMRILSEKDVIKSHISNGTIPEQEDGTEYNNGYYIVRTTKGKGDVIVELPEGKALDSFWYDSVRKRDAKYDVYASETLNGTYDELVYTGVIGKEGDETGFEWAAKEEDGTSKPRYQRSWGWSQTRYGFVPSPKNVTKAYKYVKITGNYDVIDSLNGVGLTEIVIGKMGYSWKPAADVEAGDVELKWTHGNQAESELNAQGVTVVTETGSVVLKTESNLLKNIETEQPDEKYNSYGLKLEAQTGGGTGYLLIEAPENAVFTGFWADCIKNANGQHRVYISEDGENWSDALSYASRTQLDIFRLNDDKNQNYKYTYNINSKKINGGYKYIKFKLRSDGKSDDWYQAIGKMGYSWSKIPTSVEVKYGSIDELLGRGDVTWTALTEGAQLKMESGFYDGLTDDQKAIKINTYKDGEWKENGQGYLTIKAPEGTVFTKFWVDLLFDGPTYNRVYYSKDGKNWTPAIRRSEVITDGFGETSWGHYQIQRFSFDILAAQEYKYIKFELIDSVKYPTGHPSYNYLSEIGTFGYSFSNILTSGDAELKWGDNNSCEALLKQQGVSVVTESGSVVLKTEVDYSSTQLNLLKNETTGENDTKYNAHALKLEANGTGTGYLLIEAPEGKEFTGFWVDCIRRANDWHKVYMSKDGETWSDALTAASKTKINVYREEQDRGHNYKHTYDVSDENNGYKYIKFKFRSDGGNDGWEQAIGKMGYSWKNAPAVEVTKELTAEINEAGVVTFKNTKDAAVNAQVVVASFNGNDVKDIKLWNKNSIPVGETTFTSNVNTTGCTKVSVFIWDSFSGMTPILKADKTLSTAN